jgi:hypothetical protein
MKIEWEKIEFREDDLLEAIKSKIFDSDQDDIPSTLFQGPFSVESLMDPMSFSKRHNPILGHCDFNISERRAMNIMKTEGVDFLKVITRYSFIFAPGKAFKESEVKARIEHTLGIFDHTDKTVDKLQAVQDELSGSGRHCIYERNGEVHSVHEEDQNFESVVAIYKESQKKYGGKLYEGE